MVWTDDDDTRLAELLQTEQEAEPLDTFIRRASPRLPPPPHIAPLLDMWERTRHGPVYAVIEMPPEDAP